MLISSKLLHKKNSIQFKNTVRNFITFSIVFKNKNGGGGRFPPHPSKLGVFDTPSKLRLTFQDRVTFSGVVIRATLIPCIGEFLQKNFSHMTYRKNYFYTYIFCDSYIKVFSRIL